MLPQNRLSIGEVHQEPKRLVGFDQSREGLDIVLARECLQFLRKRLAQLDGFSVCRGNGLGVGKIDSLEGIRGTGLIWVNERSRAAT